MGKETKFPFFWFLPSEVGSQEEMMDEKRNYIFSQTQVCLFTIQKSIIWEASINRKERCFNPKSGSLGRRWTWDPRQTLKIVLCHDSFFLHKFHFCFTLKRKFVHLCIYFWLCWVFIAACRFSLVVARGTTSPVYMGFSWWWLLLWWGMGSKWVGSVAVAHGLSCPTVCGIFLDQR